MTRPYLLFSEPLLSTSSAHLLSLSIAATYIGSIYFSQRGRLSLGSRTNNNGGNHDGSQRNGVKGTRDDPDIIRVRLFAVSVATALCCAAVFAVLWSQMGWGTNSFGMIWDATILRLGFPSLLNWPFPFSFPSLPSPASITSTSQHLLRLLLPHLIVPILFLGPLFASFLDEQLPGQRRWRWDTHVVQRLSSIHGLRNYIIGPVTEELVFRACVLAVWHMAGAGWGKMVGFAPLTFGLAHVHHGYEIFRLNGGNAKAAELAIITTLFQLTYTTLFGALVSFIFLRTGSVLPCISAHVFCNIMGFPNLLGELQRFPSWRLMIIAAYIIGIAGFIYTLTSWTVVTDNLYWPRGEEAFLVGRY